MLSPLPDDTQPAARTHTHDHTHTHTHTHTHQLHTYASFAHTHTHTHTHTPMTYTHTHTHKTAGLPASDLPLVTLLNPLVSLCLPSAEHFQWLFGPAVKMSSHLEAAREKEGRCADVIVGGGDVVLNQ